MNLLKLFNPRFRIPHASTTSAVVTRTCADVSIAWRHLLERMCFVRFVGVVIVFLVPGSFTRNSTPVRHLHSVAVSRFFVAALPALSCLRSRNAIATAVRRWRQRRVHQGVIEVKVIAAAALQLLRVKLQLRQLFGMWGMQLWQLVAVHFAPVELFCSDEWRCIVGLLFCTGTLCVSTRSAGSVLPCAPKITNKSCKIWTRLSWNKNRDRTSRSWLVLAYFDRDRKYFC